MDPSNQGFMDMNHRQNEKVVVDETALDLQQSYYAHETSQTEIQ